MFTSAKAIPASELAKWCACAVVLLAPGSFVVLPLVWLSRRWLSRARLTALPHREIR